MLDNRYIRVEVNFIEIFFEALEKNGKYKCWLKPDTYLPMIYIDDCIAATVISSSNSKTGSTFES